MEAWVEAQSEMPQAYLFSHVGEGNSGTVPLWLGAGVTDLAGVRVWSTRVDVAGPDRGGVYL